MIDVVKNSDVSFEELEIKRYVKETETFIDKTNNVKNIGKADFDQSISSADQIRSSCAL